MDLVFLDTETTGLDPHFNEIIDIWVRRNELVWTPNGFEISLIDEAGGRVKPVHLERMHPAAQKLNGYNDDDWADAGDFPSVWSRVAPLIKGAIIVGSNPSFDITFINTYLEGRTSERLSTRHSVDLASLGHMFLVRGEVEKVGLNHLAVYFDLEPESVHTARSGSKLTERVYTRLLQKFSFV
jgi:DNA polymerase III alpha subunit (gram-positive type)